MICIATTIPIALEVSLITTFFGIILMLAYLRIEMVKETAYISCLTWLICSALIFIISLLLGLGPMFEFGWNWIIALVFIALSSKIAK